MTTARVDERGWPSDPALDAFVARLAALAPAARARLADRAWDGRREREPLARAAAELRALVDHVQHAHLEFVCGPAFTAWRAGGDHAMAPTWLGEDGLAVLHALDADAPIVPAGWTIAAVLMAAAALYHRDAVTPATLGVLYYPFAEEIPLASLVGVHDAAMAAAPDPTVADAPPPPAVPPAARAEVARLVRFAGEATAPELQDAVDDVLWEQGMAQAAGVGAHEVAHRALDEAIARGGLRAEVDGAAELVLVALRGRADRWRIPDAAAEPDAAVTQDAMVLLTVTALAAAACVAGHELRQADTEAIRHPVFRHVERFEARRARGPSVPPVAPAAGPSRAPLALERPVGEPSAPTPDTAVYAFTVRFAGRTWHPLMAMRFADMDHHEEIVRAPDGTIPVFLHAADAVAHVRRFFPAPRGFPPDLQDSAPSDARFDLGRMAELPEVGWERTTAPGAVIGWWNVLAAAGVLPSRSRPATHRPARGSVPARWRPDFEAATGWRAGDDAALAGRLLARLWETRMAEHDAMGTQPPEASPWRDLAPAWSDADLAALRRLVIEAVDAFVACVDEIGERAAG